MTIYKRYLEEFSLEKNELVVNLDDFEMGDVIGKGGFGQVRRAIYKKTGIECGIKQIFTERLEGNRFRRYIGEIETLANCDNMFLVPFIGFTAQPPYAIVTEFMPNGSLDKYVRILLPYAGFPQSARFFQRADSEHNLLSPYSNCRSERLFQLPCIRRRLTTSKSLQLESTPPYTKQSCRNPLS